MVSTIQLSYYKKDCCTTRKSERWYGTPSILVSSVLAPITFLVLGRGFILKTLAKSQL
ncbi:hypothetical protein HMPREF3198_00966 [Winkia neuii]|nr:hypothetical protein HMPREF3198_00966 [Winkia neuii]